MSDLIALAERCEALVGKLHRAVDNPDNLSAAGQALVIAMLVTLELNMLSECAAALRTPTTEPGNG